VLAKHYRPGDAGANGTSWLTFIVKRTRAGTISMWRQVTRRGMKMVVASENRSRARSLAAFSLGALGVVYGDIGTSPLYTVKEIFTGSGGIPLTPANVVGVMSVILWALMIVVSLKYVTLILRADNHGEGGIMALLALVISAVKARPRLRYGLMLAGVFGAALFYGDGVITPAISVLSAVEGLEVAAPRLTPYVVPLTVAIIVLLFLIQKKGTASVGALFGPVMMVWFGVLALGGVLHVYAAPEILAALNPYYGLRFLYQNGWVAFVGLGSIVLALTGAEALYADMGHFGRGPIRLAWFSFVFPALALNYLGQGALIMSDPKAIANPFYLLFPTWLLYPMIGLATAATVIASQAVITGTYSMTQQAIQLGFLPRTHIVHTSDKEEGQIYIPSINMMLLLAVVAAVIGFGSSTNLASAYGVAVTGTMLITTVLTFFVVRYAWRYNWLLCVLATGFFLVIDLAFFSANTLKIAQGGWFPLVVGLAIFTIMTTWKRGREILVTHLRQTQIPLMPFLESLVAEDIVRVSNTAIFLVANPEGVPNALLHNLAHNQILHERVIFLTVIYREIPYVPDEKRVRVEALLRGFYRVRVFYGFMDKPDLIAALEACRGDGLEFNLLATSFFVSRETIVPTPDGGMADWREQLFATMTRLAGSAADYLNIPTNRVIEVGTRIEI
jgi:KUP system potassium uptake protein